MNFPTYFDFVVLVALLLSLAVGDLLLSRKHSEPTMHKMGRGDTIKGYLLTARVAIDIIFSILLNITMFYLSMTLVYSSILIINSDFFSSVILKNAISGALLLLSFSAISFSLHILFFYFGGFIRSAMERHISARSWPKIIDYLYYSIGALFLLFLLFEYGGSGASNGLKLATQIVSGTFLLNAKLIKTSIEIFPEKFASERVAVRGIFGSDLIGLDNSKR
jgi:hypothetical protein